MAFDAVLFYLFAALAVGASLLVIGQRNPVYSVLLLIASFAALAGLYVLLDAPFAAVTQMIVYAGAIMVLFLFVVMLLNVPREDAAEWDRSHPLNRPGAMRFGAVLAGLLLLELSWAVWHVSTRQPMALSETSPGSVASVAAIGRSIFTDYAFPFEATSVLILVAMVGAVITLNHYLALSAMLFAIGTAGVFLRRNVITLLLSIEIMLNAVNLTFIAAGRQFAAVDGQVIVFFVMTVAAAEAAVGLAIVIALFRHRESLNPEAFTSLKW